MKNDLYDDIFVNYLYNVHIWNLKYIHTYIHSPSEPLPGKKLHIWGTSNVIGNLYLFIFALNTN